jgi:tetraacyldisaccharide 4'-kinase
MRDGLLEFGREAIAGRAHGPAASLFRATASLVEPFYSAVTTARNTAFDRGWSRSCDLGRPTISVGNITTGGTGKTPVVKWLAERLRRAGHRPAILMRGYAGGPGGKSDEQMLLDRGLNSGSGPKIPVTANPSRIDGAAAVLAADPSVDRFVLDDGFQHRRARRGFDLVLVNATDPFGGGRVLPRGLLREPLSGLRRAHAFLITRVSLAPAEAVKTIDKRLSEFGVPVYRTDHVPTPNLESMAGKAVVAVSGIGDPESFERQLTAAGATIADRFRFGDHHRYTAADLAEVMRRAQGASLVTTEKDWVKIEPLVGPAGRSAWTFAGVEIRFHGDDERRLLRQIEPGGGFPEVKSDISIATSCNAD